MKSLSTAEVAEICTEYVNGGLSRFRLAIQNGTSADIIHLTMGLISIAGYTGEKALARTQTFLGGNSEDMTPESISEAVEEPRDKWSQNDNEEEEEEEEEADNEE